MLKPVGMLKPPPWRALHEAMQKALAGNGYVPVEGSAARPALLIVFSYGMHSTDLTLLPGTDENDREPRTAEEFVGRLVAARPWDPKAGRDVVERARFIGGNKVARELELALRSELVNSLMVGAPINPEPESPFQLLLNGSAGPTMRHVLELAFHTCYFVTATAYDFGGVEKKQKIPLWQTRMTVEAQGVDISEVLKPLIVNTGSYLGRETAEAVIVDKRISREGRVEIGEAVVVPDAKTAPAATAPAETKN